MSAVADFARSDWGAFGTALEVVGMIPVVGDVADGILCAKSVVAGNLADAAFDCASMIPMAGNGARAAKWGKKAVDGAQMLEKADDVRDTARAVNAAHDVSKSSSVMDDLAGAACRSNSFDGDTRVVMADGSRKPIRDVAKGDRVRATDPVSGRTEGRVVTDTIVGEGDKGLVDVVVASGAVGAAVTTLVATDQHPFWVADDGGWVAAEDLVVGDDLLTSAGERVQVVGLREYRQHKKVHNLTVDGIHTYYVATDDGGDALVHNCANSPIHSAYADGTTVTKAQRPPRLGEAIPDPAAAGASHSRLRWDTANNRVYQAREFDAGGSPVRDIDFTGPTYPSGNLRPDHYVPEQHPWIINDPSIGPRSGFRRSKESFPL